MKNEKRRQIEPTKRENATVAICESWEKREETSTEKDTRPAPPGRAELHPYLYAFQLREILISPNARYRRTALSCRAGEAGAPIGLAEAIIIGVPS